MGIRFASSVLLCAAVLSGCSQNAGSGGGWVCKGNADCSGGATCDLASGRCVAPREGVDGGNGTTAGQVGSACATGADCDDGTCMDGLPGGYCTKADCEDSGCPEGSQCFGIEGGSIPSACFRTCAASSECRTGEGYVCDADKTCYPGGSTSTGDVPPGGPCTADGQCAGGGQCYPEESRGEATGWVGGYCMIWECTAASCPAGSSCYALETSGGGTANICLATCADAASCRAGYVCKSVRENMPTACWPGCAADAQCPAGYVCDTADKRCRSTAGECSQANPSGACPAGQVCNAGTCETFQCTDTRNEPNETPAQATPVQAGTDTGLALCAADKDWYSMEVPPRHIGRLGIQFQKTSGDLDLTAWASSTGSCLGGRFMQSCGSYPRDYETGEEYLSVYNPGDTGDLPFAWQVLGYRGATNLYTLVRELVPFSDGRDCGAPYTTADCTGRDAQGRANLVQWPYAAPDDPYTGDAWRFDSMANYRWIRREVMMLVRYALRETRAKFENTKPLGLIDMCQRDGITPGYDVNDPRHPESTHDQGGNIDIAYFTTLASNGSLPYNEARIICNPSEGAVQSGAYCAASASNTHVVDLPRQVYFMAKLYESARIRVIGADRVIGPLLQQEAARQLSEGWITAAQKNSFTSRLAFDAMNCESNSSCGWPFHHHHIHVSFKWWSQGRSAGLQPRDGCGFDLLKYRRR